MADTFTNDLRLRLQESGANSGQWGTLLNTTISNIASAFSLGSEAIANASTHTITLADGTADEARSMYLKCTGGGQACTVTLAPNTISKVWIISNETSFTLTFTQGSGANVAVAAGAVKMIVTDGAGSGAAVTDALSGLDASLSGLTVDTTTLVVDATNNRVGIGTSSPTGLFTSFKSQNGDPKLGHFYNDNTGTAAEATVYITNSSSVADGLFLQAYGQNGTAAGGFVQDAAVMGSGTGASGGLSIMTRANADMRFYTNGHTNERMRIDSGGHTSFTLGTNAMGTFGDSISEVGSGNFALQVTNSAGSALKPLGFRAEDIRFATGSTEVFRLTSAQDMYFGQTSGSAADTGHIMQANGVMFHTMQDGPPLRLRRNTSDGVVIEISKDGNSCGHIGTHSGDEIFFGNSSNIGMRTEQTGADRFEPCTGTGAARNNAIDLGIAGNQWRSIFCQAVTESSDRSLKQDIEELSDSEQRVAVRAKSLLRKYRLISDVEDGDNRYSVGIIAQDLQDAFTAEGLDAANYKMWRSDTFVDEVTGQEKTQQSIVYSQLLAFIISAL